MDNDLISRSALRDQLGKYFFLHDGNDFMEVMRKVEKAPAVDPETLRPTGRWELDGSCSECREHPLTTHRKYCPNCGAKMMEG